MKLKDDWPDKDGGEFDVRECLFCHLPPKEITHIQHPGELGNGTKMARAVRCGHGCNVYGPIRDTASEAVQAWNEMNEMIDADASGKIPEKVNEWERELQELQRKHNATVVSINRGHRNRMILLVVVVVLAVLASIIMVF